MTDANGIAQTTYTYEPYDATTVIPGPNGVVPNPWRFAAGYHDTTGWYKFGMRYYSGRLGRWSQLDPVEQPTDPTQQNRFGYAGGDPVNRTDPTGEFTGYACELFQQSGDSLSTWCGGETGVSTPRAIDRAVTIYCNFGGILLGPISGGACAGWDISKASDGEF